MVTLTYPADWECVAPDGASVKRHVMLWRKRFQREWGEPARYIWKLEFQRRGAPHIHLWMAPPHAVGRSDRKFRDWLSQEWTDIVAHPDPEQRARHSLAGTAIDILNGLRACDPKRLRSTSRNIRRQMPKATRNTSTSSRKPGGSRGTDRVAFGRSMGCNEQPQSWRSPRSRTSRREGSSVAGLARTPSTAIAHISSPLRSFPG
jgi:hypothetical protein